MAGEFGLQPHQRTPAGSPSPAAPSRSGSGPMVFRWAASSGPKR